MDLQKIIDTMNAAGREMRASYHVTLGGLIEALQKADPAAPVLIVCEGQEAEQVRSPDAPMSYRGYYDDLAFSETTTPQAVATVLEAATEVLGETLEGYKGGNYRMEERTPIWISGWGRCTGEAVMAVEERDGAVCLMTRIID